MSNFVFVLYHDYFRQETDRLKHIAQSRLDEINTAAETNKLRKQMMKLEETSRLADNKGRGRMGDLYIQEEQEIKLQSQLQEKEAVSLYI